MLYNYFKITIRQLIKHKGFSIINISGLAIGMTCSMFILLWVRDELSYDKFQRDGDRTYRVNLHLEENDIKAALTCAPLAENIKRQLPGTEDVIRMSMYNVDLFQVDDRIFEENGVCYADSNFFDFFTFPFVEGDPATALDQPESIVLTEQMAIKYFGTTEIVGRTIRKSNKNQVFTVTGVMKDVPANSHLRFSCIEPMSFLARTSDDLIRDRWDNFGWNTYIKLDKPARTGELQVKNEQINTIYKEHEKTFKASFFLQPIEEIHFTTGLLFDVPGITDRQYVFIFSVVGIFIMIVACINFMNLATARSARRAREVGLRKVAGAFRTQLIFQFLSESTAIAAAALVIAIALVAAFLPFFDDLTGKSLSDTLFDPELLIGIALITLITGLLSGAYPAIFLSRFVPVKVLKGDLAKAGAGSIFRNIMVVIQFSISITLLVGTAVVFQQMQFISNRNLGYDKENLLYVPIRGNLGDDIERLRTLLKSNPATSNFSIVSQLPTNLANGTVNVQWDGKDENTQPLFPNMAVDENFVDVFKMTLLNGRTFSRGIKGDSANYMVNEEALKVMNMTPDDAVGKALSLFGVKGVIIGVVKNFNFKPVQSAIEPMIIQLNGGFGSVVVRTQPGQAEATIGALREVCERLNPQYPFSYAFVDEDFERMYQSERRLGKLFGIFTMLGIFISCLGLYGLSAFLTERRTKEIGVRKVLGASVAGTTWLLSRSLMRPVFIATLIATPLAWYIMDRWLESFVYRVTVGWEILVFALGVSLLVVIVTVSSETVKAALANPARSLRSE